nr:LPS assembly protein LptD [Pantoea sp. Mhis]
MSLFAEDLMSECMINIPHYHQLFIMDNNNSTSLPIIIHSNLAKGNYPNNIVFNGNVNVQQGNSLLYAHEVRLHQYLKKKQAILIRTMDALGNVHYHDEKIILKGNQAWLNLNNKDTNIWNADYQIVGKQGHGSAEQIKLRDNNRYIILTNGSFSSCISGINSWSITGSKLIQDRQKKITKIWNARFKIGKVPIFYSPYLSFPIDDNRTSGFLLPHAKFSNTNGFELIFPYYWNILPQSDATTSIHYMSKHGVLLQNEFRYLIPSSSGFINFNYLLLSYDHYNNRLLNRNILKNNSNGWLFYWRHIDDYNHHWYFDIDYFKINEFFYFKDLHLNNLNKDYFTQNISAGYLNNNWNIMLYTKNFYSLNEKYSVSYRAVPELDLNFYLTNIKPFEGHIYAQIVRFNNINKLMPKAIRFHIEPSLNLSLNNDWFNLNTEVKFLATHYKQSNIHYLRQSHYLLSYVVNRTLPQFKIDGSLRFYKNINRVKGYNQILEPHIKYIYIPYRDQSNIYLYDTTELQIDYNSLFSENSYSGLDRIASSNKVITGITTRINDKNFIERFNVSVGQIYCFSPSNASDIHIQKKEKDRGTIVWSGETFWKISNHLHVKSELQYSPFIHRISHSNSILEYRINDKDMVQLNFDYCNPIYISHILNNKHYPIYTNGFSQIGIVANWMITSHWSLVASYHYDVVNNRSTENLIGLSYNSCCYSIRLGYKRNINNSQNNNIIYNNQISFNIEIRGLK